MDDDELARIRRFAAERIEATSLRSVAREVGMSPTGLKKVVEGTRPYRPTMRKLAKWAAREEPERRMREREGAIAVLLDDVPEALRGAAHEALRQALAPYEPPPAESRKPPSRPPRGGRRSRAR